MEDWGDSYDDMDGESWEDYSDLHVDGEDERFFEMQNNQENPEEPESDVAYRDPRPANWVD
jgi:hypothetical protein